MEPQNYTLGRGEVHFARFVDEVNKIPGGFRYIGNTPEFNLTVEEERLDHFSSDFGIREKDDSITLEVNRTGTFTTDSIKLDNIALFFFGDSSDISTVSTTITAEEVNAVVPGLQYQLGLTTENPVGNRGIVFPGVAGPPSTEFVVTDDTTPTPTTFDVNDDYRLDAASGLLYIVPGGAITAGTNLRVTYTVAASTSKQVISGARPVEGAIRYIARNPKGENFDYLIPWASISPNGDYALKGDEWQTIPFTFEILKAVGREAVYVNNRPFIS